MYTWLFPLVISMSILCTVLCGHRWIRGATGISLPLWCLKLDWDSAGMVHWTHMDTWTYPNPSNIIWNFWSIYRIASHTARLNIETQFAYCGIPHPRSFHPTDHNFDLHFSHATHHNKNKARYAKFVGKHQYNYLF